MRFWGVTGTNGKTTTAWILADFISSQPGRRAGYITTVEVNTTKRTFYSGYTTPPLSELCRIYDEMQDAGCTDCVMEVSSHAIHQNRVGFGDVTVFSGGAFTNLTEDHLDYHKTMDEYFKVKLLFAEKIALSHVSAPEAGRAQMPSFVVCLDGGCGREMFLEASKYSVNVIPVTREHPRYDLTSLKLKGAYNESNVLLAAALAECAGVDREVIAERIPKLEPRWGRLERIENPKVSAEVYVDFAHTPDGLEKVLEASRQFTSGKLWVVFGAGGDRDPMKRPLMGAAAARAADMIIVTSDNPRSENPEKIIQAILSGIPQEKRERVFLEPDRRKAIEIALSEASKSDVVIIAGKGHETTQEISGVKYPFDDREVVRKF